MVKDIKSERKQWKHLFFFSDIACLHQLQVHFKGPTWCKIHIMFPSSDVTHSSLSANSSEMWKVHPLLFLTYSPSRKCFLKHTVLDFIPLWCHWCHSQVTDTLLTETPSDGRLCFCLLPSMAGPTTVETNTLGCLKFVHHPASSVMPWPPHGYRSSSGEEKKIDDSPIKAHIR